MSRNFTTRSRCESELIASLISVTRELNSSLFCIVDQCDPIIRSSHWLVYSPCFRGCQLFSSYLLCHAVSSHDGDLVMCFTWSWLNKKGFRQMCALSRFTSRVREGSFCLLQRSKAAAALKSTAYLRAAERKLLQSHRRHRRIAVSAQLRLQFFELPDSPQDQDSGRSEMSDSDDLYQSGHEYPDSRSIMMREK